MSMGPLPLPLRRARGNNRAVHDYDDARIAQAMGMVSVQVGCTVDDALLLMKARAESDSVGVDEIASAVLERTIRFDD